MLSKLSVSECIYGPARVGSVAVAREPKKTPPAWLLSSLRLFFLYI